MNSEVKNILSLRTKVGHGELTKAEVDAFASQQFIKKALSKPFKMKSILSFFFGIDYDSKEFIDQMRSGECLKTMSAYWFRCHKEYDKLCSAFSETVEAAGKGELEFEDENTVDAKMAKLLLLDQLSRNCFRGTPKAYSFDAIAQLLVREIAPPLIRAMEQPADIPSIGPSIEQLKGEFYPPYISFIITALTHSEQLEDHELCQQLLQRAVETSPPHLHVYFEGEEQAELVRKEILQRFGRYPHRNRTLGRSSTPEEEAWLANEKDLPEWARRKS